MPKHKFESYGWDNYDCRHCGISGYTAQYDHCEDEKDYKKTSLYKRLKEKEDQTVKLHLTPLKSDEGNAAFVKDLLDLLRKHKYIP